MLLCRVTAVSDGSRIQGSVSDCSHIQGRWLARLHTCSPCVPLAT